VEKKVKDAWEMDKKVILEWAKMICGAMAYVHSMEILHRDLKPSNLLLTLDPLSQKTVVKIADFGLSYELMKSRSKASTRAGTAIYWAPEIFQGEMPGKAADVYAVGAILYELCMGPSKPATSLLLSEKKVDLLNEIKLFYGSADLYILISCMVQYLPSDRPAFQQVVEALNTNDFHKLLNEHGTIENTT